MRVLLRSALKPCRMILGWRQLARQPSSFSVGRRGDQPSDRWALRCVSNRRSTTFGGVFHLAGRGGVGSRILLARSGLLSTTGLLARCAVPGRVRIGGAAGGGCVGALIVGRVGPAGGGAGALGRAGHGCRGRSSARRGAARGTARRLGKGKPGRHCQNCRGQKYAFHLLSPVLNARHALVNPTGRPKECSAYEVSTFVTPALRLRARSAKRTALILFVPSRAPALETFRRHVEGKRHDVVGFGNVATVRSSAWIAIKGMAAGNNIIHKVSAPLHGPVAGRSMRCRWRCYYFDAMLNCSPPMFRAALDLSPSGGLLIRVGMSGSINCNRPSPELLLILEPVPLSAAWVGHWNERRVREFFR